jgi:hypothetical protein
VLARVCAAPIVDAIARARDRRVESARARDLARSHSACD